MSNINKVRIGVVGLGNIGIKHCMSIADGSVENAVLTAVCNRGTGWEDRIGDLPGAADLALFSDPDEMYASGLVDAVVIAVPHYQHAKMGISALEHGLHLMVEKPLGAYSLQARALIDAAEKTDRVFAVMLNQRTNPYYRSIREAVRGGMIGELQRVSWTITDWFRPQAYYDSAAWRGTWAGEGGGVLINQCLHNLDLLIWMCGMPKRVQAFCSRGKYHDIETEDEAAVYMEFENGATGVLVTSTGEAPGTNRLEICGRSGKIVHEGDGAPVLTQMDTDTGALLGAPHIPDPVKSVKIISRPLTEEIDAAKQRLGQRTEVLNNWAAAIRGEEKLLAPGREGLNSIMLTNAIYLSAWKGTPVDIPFDEEDYLRRLREAAGGELPE